MLCPSPNCRGGDDDYDSSLLSSKHDLSPSSQANFHLSCLATHIPLPPSVLRLPLPSCLSHLPHMHSSQSVTEVHGHCMQRECSESARSMLSLYGIETASTKGLGSPLDVMCLIRHELVHSTTLSVFQKIVHVYMMLT